MKKYTMIKLLALAMSVLMIGSQLLACSFYGNNGYYGESDDERDVESDGSGNSEGENNNSNENNSSNENSNSNENNGSNENNSNNENNNSNENNSSNENNNENSNENNGSNENNNNGDSNGSGGDEPNAENIVFTNRTTYLPDPDKFFNGELARNEDMTTKEGNLISYKFDVSGRDAATEYVAALLDSKFLLTRKTDTYDEFNDNSSVGSFNYAYRFYYIGDGSVGTAHDIDIFTDESVDCSVFVSIINNFRKGYTLMTLYYADGFEFYDAGHRSTVTGLVDFSDNEPSSGTGGGSGSWNPLGDTCQYCNGRGTRACLTCDGKGYVEMWISVPNYSGHGSTGGYERHDCPNALCRNGQVTCMFCGGTGRR